MFSPVTSCRVLFPSHQLLQCGPGGKVPLVPSPEEGQLTGRGMCVSETAPCAPLDEGTTMCLLTGVPLLAAQHLAFQSPCSGATAGPSLAKTVRSWGAPYSQEKASLEDEQCWHY